MDQAQDPDPPTEGPLARLATAGALGLIGAVWAFRGAYKDGEQEVAANLYRESGFWHNAQLEGREAAAAGLEAARSAGLWVAGLAAAGLLLVWALPVLRNPRRALEAFRGTLAPALAIAAWAGYVLLGGWCLTQERSARGTGWLMPADLEVAGLALGAGVLLVLLATALARAGRPDQLGRWRAAHLRALLVGGGVLLGLGYWVNRGVWSPPADAGVLTRNLWIGAAALAAWAAMLWRHGLGRGVWPVSCVLALAAVAWAWLPLTSRADDGPSFAARRPVNVVVIALDTVRADMTSMLGDRPKQRDTTPNLRELAERGVNFSNAISQAPWTIPAFASILTGKYPHEHGALVLDAKLSKKQVTLAEVLREAGYETYGVVSHMFLQEFRGFAQGFEHYDESPTLVPDIHQAASSIPVTDSALAFLRQRGDDERPFFLFAHYFDPHYEYLDHQGWDFADQYEGWFRDQLDFENIQKNSRYLSEEDRQWLIDLYQEELAYTDRHIGRLLDYLETSGLDRNTLIVVVSDHGEAFGEHGYYGHTVVLDQEVVHVPLAIVPPRGHVTERGPFEPRVIDAPIETRGVFGAVLGFLGLDRRRPGEDAAWELGPALRADPLRLARTEGPKRAFSGVFLEHTDPRYGKRVRKAALVEERYKMIYDMLRVELRLYDLEADPGELRPLGPGRNAEVYKPMQERLFEWIQRMERTKVAVDTAEVSPDAAAALRALGYVGSTE